MRVTTKGRYAVSAMIELTLHQAGDDRVTLSDIAELQGISLSYLEQIFAQLRTAGLVRGTRGPGGGYILGKPAADISIADIITSVDESVDVTACSGANNCEHGYQCLTHDLWVMLSDRLYQFLNEIRLSEIVAWPNVQQVAERQQRQLHGRSNVQVAVPIS